MIDSLKMHQMLDWQSEMHMIDSMKYVQKQTVVHKRAPLQYTGQFPGCSYVDIPRLPYESVIFGVTESPV